MKGLKNLANAILYDAFVDLRDPERRNGALNFLMGDRVGIWAGILKRDPIKISRLAKAIYKNPDLLPKNGKRLGKRRKYDSDRL